MTLTTLALARPPPALIHTLWCIPACHILDARQVFPCLSVASLFRGATYFDACVRGPKASTGRNNAGHIRGGTGMQDVTGRFRVFYCMGSPLCEVTDCGGEKGSDRLVFLSMT